MSLCRARVIYASVAPTRAVTRHCPCKTGAAWLAISLSVWMYLAPVSVLATAASLPILPPSYLTHRRCGSICRLFPRYCAAELQRLISPLGLGDLLLGIVPPRCPSLVGLELQLSTQP